MDRAFLQEDGQSDPNRDSVVLSQDEQKRLSRLRLTLDEAGVDYTIFAHAETVTSAEKGVEKGFGTLATMAPTLILNSEQGCIAAIISGETRLVYKKIRATLGLKNVSLARPDLVQRVTGSQIGTVALVNQGLPTIIDIRLRAFDVVYGGCGVPRHTLRISVSDLIKVAQARLFDFTEPKDTATSRRENSSAPTTSRETPD